MSSTADVGQMANTAIQPEAPSAAAAAVDPSVVAVRLSLLVAALAAAATSAGLLWRTAGEVAAVRTVHGISVGVFGEGLYRNDSVFKAAGNIGADWVTLVAAVPLLLAATRAYRRGTLAGALSLAGLLAWFLYLYASLALGTAYNELFLVYVALLSTSLAAFVLTLRSVDLAASAPVLLSGLPRRGLAWFLFAAGGLTTIVWVGPLVGGLLAGRPPTLLLHSTTMVTEALDLAIITPATVLAGVLLLRRRAEGYLVAFPLLVLLLVLCPVIAAQTFFQLDAGWAFTTQEIVGPISGFLILGSGALWLVVRILRGVRVQRA